MFQWVVRLVSTGFGSRTALPRAEGSRMLPLRMCSSMLSFERRDAGMGEHVDHTDIETRFPEPPVSRDQLQ